MRLIDEFLAKAAIGQCSNFADTAEVISKVGFKMFLGITAEVRTCPANRRADLSTPVAVLLMDVAIHARCCFGTQVVVGGSHEFSLQLPENPLAEFVELPEQYGSLAYSNMLCGVLRGALEMVQMRVECTLTKDALWGDEVTEIRVVLKEMMEEEYIDED